MRRYTHKKGFVRGGRRQPYPFCASACSTGATFITCLISTHFPLPPLVCLSWSPATLPQSSALSCQLASLLPICPPDRFQDCILKSKLDYVKALLSSLQRLPSALKTLNSQLGLQKVISFHSCLLSCLT